MNSRSLFARKCVNYAVDRTKIHETMNLNLIGVKTMGKDTFGGRKFISKVAEM